MWQKIARFKLVRHMIVACRINLNIVGKSVSINAGGDQFFFFSFDGLGQFFASSPHCLTVSGVY